MSIKIRSFGPPLLQFGLIFQPRYEEKSMFDNMASISFIILYGVETRYLQDFGTGPAYE